jgi:ferric-dicitrate binding protein FerR (iron transport regulator)
MNFTPDDNPRDWLERMLIKLREGEATPDEVAQLRALLAGDAEARRVYLRAKQMDTLLETAATKQVALRRSVKDEASVLHRWKIAAFAGAAAAVVALAFLGFWERPQVLRDRDAAVAVLKSSFEAVIDGREVLMGEQSMRAGTYKLERGSVQLRFGNGADVVIEGPAAFDLVDAATMHLNQGSLWAHCSEEARGFAVRMPGGRELVDFGTEFGARVDAEGGAEVQVMQGEVKISDAVAKPLDLTTGKAAHWELTAPPLAMNTTKVKPFQTAIMLADKVKSAPATDDQTRVYYKGLRGEWNRASAWSTGALPGAHELERVVLNHGQNIQVTPNTPPSAHPVDIHVSNAPGSASGPDATLEIMGNLECQMLRIATAGKTDGLVRQTGGTLNVTDSFIASSNTGSAARSVYVLSDGALNVGHELALGRYGPSEFTLKGSKGTVTADRMYLGAGAVLSFVLDSDGAGLIKLRDTIVRNNQARLVIDGTQYRGGPKTIPLVVCGADLTEKSRFAPKQMSFTGFAGVLPRLAFHLGGIDLVLEAVR